jgi:hypothetical protein
MALNPRNLAVDGLLSSVRSIALGGETVDVQTVQAAWFPTQLTDSYSGGGAVGGGGGSWRPSDDLLATIGQRMTKSARPSHWGGNYRVVDQSQQQLADEQARRIEEDELGLDGQRSSGLGLLMVAARAAARGRLLPVVRDWAVRQLLEQVVGEGERERAVALFEGVRRSMLNVPNPVGAQFLAGPDATAGDDPQVVAGSCADQSVKLASSLLSIGIRCALVGQSKRPSGAISHMFVAAFVDGQWMLLDPATRQLGPGEHRQGADEHWVYLPECTLDFEEAQAGAMAEARADWFPVVGVGDVSLEDARPADQAIIGPAPALPNLDRLLKILAIAGICAASALFIYAVYRLVGG